MASSRTMSRCTLLQDILSRLNNDGKESDVQVGDADEETEELGGGLDWDEGEGAVAAPAAQSDRKTRTQYRRRAAVRLQELRLPETAPEAAIDAAAAKAIPLIPVSFHVVDRKTVWIDVNSLAWAMRYLHQQWTLQGVSLSVDSPGSASGSQSSSQRDSPVSWRFQERGWVLEGPDAPKTILRPKDLRVQHLDVDLDSLDGLDYSRLKALAKQVMERKAVAQSV